MARGNRVTLERSKQFSYFSGRRTLDFTTDHAALRYACWGFNLIYMAIMAGGTIYLLT